LPNASLKIEYTNIFVLSFGSPALKMSTYQAKSWSKPRKVIIQSVRPAGELFFIHSFFVTNLERAFSPIEESNFSPRTNEHNMLDNSYFEKD
jgi:hypothetical protein